MNLDLSLPQFTTLLMRELRMAEYPTPCQLQVLDFLADESITRKEIVAFRGIGKSTLTAMANLWWLYRNPDEKILIVSASSKRAEAMSAWMLHTICRVDWLMHMKPDTHDGRYSKLAFDVGTCRNIEQSPSVRAAGITGQIVGSRASRIVSDDIETIQTALTQGQREKLADNVNEFEAILKPDPGCSITFLGTPHSSTDSIYFRLHRERHYVMRMWPARVPETLEPYHGCLAPAVAERVGRDTGMPTDTRFTHQQLVERQLRMSPSNWRMQYMLDCTLVDAERYPLRAGQLVVTDIGLSVPEVVVYEKAKDLVIEDLPCVGMPHDSRFYRPRSMTGAIPANDVPTVMALDPSGGGSDEFAWAVVKVWAGNFFLVASGGRKGGSSAELWADLASIAKKHHVNKILVETNFGGLAVWEQSIKPFLQQAQHSCAVEPVRSAGMRKELRIIDTLAPIMQLHRLVVDREVIERDYEGIRNAERERDAAYSLIYQMTRLTADKGALLHDDRLDALAMACEHFQSQQAADQKVRLAEREAETLAAELADWNGHVVLSAQRLAMGMTLETARRADAGGRGVNMLRRGNRLRASARRR